MLVIGLEVNNLLVFRICFMLIRIKYFFLLVYETGYEELGVFVYYKYDRNVVNYSCLS